MTDASIDEPQPVSARKLARALAAAPGAAFAVLDGAQFADLPAALAEAQLHGRPLYHFTRSGTEDARRTAPVLVDADLKTDPGALDRVLGLVGAAPAAVFWIAPDEETLFRHLRGINKVLIPRERMPGGDFAEAAEPDPEDAEDEFVLFRHADANVMAQVVPALDPAATARLLGPASAIVYVPDALYTGGSAGAVQMAARSDGLPPPAAGPLRLDPEAMARVRDARVEGSRRRIKGFLRKHQPPNFEPMPEATMDDLVATSARTGSELGIVSERGHARWAYLMMMSDGRVADIPEATQFVRQGPDPDRNVKVLIDEAAKAIRNGAGQ